MTPNSFDPATSREMTGDDRARTIEAKARADADKGTFDPPAHGDGSYWAQCQAAFERQVYTAQFHKRTLRNERTSHTRTT